MVYHISSVSPQLKRTRTAKIDKHFKWRIRICLRANTTNQIEYFQLNAIEHTHIIWPHAVAGRFPFKLKNRDVIINN